MALATYSHALKRYIDFDDLRAIHTPDHHDHYRDRHVYHFHGLDRDIHRDLKEYRGRDGKTIVVFDPKNHHYDRIIHKAGCGGGGFGSRLGFGGVTFSPVPTFGIGAGFGLGVPTIGLPAIAPAPLAYAAPAPVAYAAPAPVAYTAPAPVAYAAPAPAPVSYAPPVPTYSMATPPPAAAVYNSPSNVVSLAPDVIKGPDTVYLKPPAISVPGQSYTVNEGGGNTGSGYSVAQPMQAAQVAQQTPYSFNPAATTTTAAVQTQYQPQPQSYSAFTSTQPQYGTVTTVAPRC